VAEPIKYRVRNAFLRGLTKLMIFLVRVLPLSVSFAIARGMARLAALIQPHLIRNALTNLRIAYGGAKSAREMKVIARDSLVNLALTTVEFMKMGQVSGESVKAMCAEERGGIERLREYLKAGQGVIGLGMHLGNWEWSGAFIALNGLPMYAVGKPQRDDYFSNLAFPWRERHGITNILKSARIDLKIIRALRNSGVLGLISDQNGGRNGVFAPLFGIEASNVEGPAALHLKFKSPLVPIVAWRKAPGRFVFDVREAIDTSDLLSDDESDNPRMTRDERIREVWIRINRVYEEIILEHPEQWLWIHKRFNTRPPGEDGLYK